MNSSRVSRESLLKAMEYADSHVKDVFEPYVVKPFANAIDTNRDDWTEKYHDEQATYLRTNFSKERFRHLVDVREYLREQGVRGFVPRDAGKE